MEDGSAAAMILSFGFAALIVAVGFLAVYTYKAKYQPVMFGGCALALAALHAVFALSAHNSGDALWATTFALLGLWQFREYRRARNSGAKGT
jgi:hypothetical protein